MKNSNRKVAILFRFVPQYRKRFYELLRERLDELGIEFILIYGQTGVKEATKKDQVEIPWGKKINNRIIHLGSKELYWQPSLKELKDMDLIIVEQAAKYLINYLLVLANILGVKRVAFWGHGKNFQSDTRSWLAEKIKRYMSQKVHWWFAYNDMSMQIVKSSGFPEERITSVNNSIDTKELVRTKEAILDDDLLAIRKDLRLTGDNICIFCAAMYEEKCLDFLLEACKIIKEQIIDFQIIFLGAGPEQGKIVNMSAYHSWIHYVGPKFNNEKVAYFLLSKLYLMPGGVGLGILDSFALETPLITTCKEGHGPEIDYLSKNNNGIMVDFEVREYAQVVVDVLRNDCVRQKLIQGCRESVKVYSIESMVENFAVGIMKALDKEI